MMTIIYFIIALSILIIVHELGHFIVARLSGIRVEKFSVGFGPKIWSLKKGDTEYKLSALPFGGYVKMSGEEISELDKDDPHAFYNKSVLARARVVAAGPIMNIVLCIALMPIVFMIGRSEPAFFVETPVISDIRADSPAIKAGLEKGDVILKVGRKDVGTWKDVIDEVLITMGQDTTITLKRNGDVISKGVHVEQTPGGQGGYLGVEPHFFIGNEAVVDQLQPGLPAEKAGLKVGDRVIAVDGKPVKDWTDMVEAISKSGGNDITMAVLRNGEELEVTLRTEYDKRVERYVIGISKDVGMRNVPMTEVRYGFSKSVKEGMAEVERLTAMTFRVLGKLLSLQISYKALGGPIQIAQATAAAARSGLASFIYFLSFLSLQLGILNLLPIPVLDGGHLLFFGVEAVRRRPLSERVMGVAQQVGLGLIILLLVMVSFNDLMNIDFIQNIINRLF